MPQLSHVLSKNREYILTIKPHRWHSSRWSRQLLMRRSWDWKFSPTPNEKWSQRTWQRQDHHMMKREHEATRKDVWENKNILNSRHYNSPITYKLKSIWVYVGMEITSSRIRQRPRKVSTTSPTRYLRVYSATIKPNHSTTMINWKFLSLDISNLFEGAKDKFS